MTENISYTKCVCDFCKKEVHIDEDLCIPIGWMIVNIGKNYDICPDCYDKLQRKIELDLMKDYKPWMENKKDE